MQKRLLFLTFFITFQLFASEITPAPREVRESNEDVEPLLRGYTAVQVGDGREMLDVNLESQPSINRGDSDEELSEQRDCCKRLKTCKKKCCDCCDIFCDNIQWIVSGTSVTAVLTMIIYAQKKSN